MAGEAAAAISSGTAAPQKPPKKGADDEDDYDNVPLSLSRGKKKASDASSSKGKEEEEEENNMPLLLSRAKKASSAGASKVKKEEEDDEEDYVPLSLSRAKKASNAGASKVKEDDDDEEDYVPLSLSRAKKGNQKQKSTVNRGAKASKVKREETDSDDDCKMADNAEWNDENTRIVCELFVEQVEAGNHLNTHLNNLGYTLVIAKFAEKTRLQYKKMQLKNKWDKLKNDYNIWRKLRTKETGLGWDHEKKTIKATPEQWKKFKKEYKGCSKFEKAGLQNEELLSKMFDAIRNTGEDHWSPAMGTLPQNPVRASTAIDIEEFEDENDDKYNSDCEDESPIGRKGKRGCDPSNIKGKKPKSGSAVMQDQLRRILELNEKSLASFEAFVQKREENSVCSIKDVMELVKECGAINGSNEHFIASEIFLKKGQREMFMTLRNSEARFKWLKRKYDAKYGK